MAELGKNSGYSGYYELKVWVGENTRRAPSFPSGSGQAYKLAPCLCPSFPGSLAAAHGPSAHRDVHANQAGPGLRLQHRPAEQNQPALTCVEASGGNACQAVRLCWLPDHRLMPC